MKRGPEARDFKIRFFEKVEKGKEDECWKWISTMSNSIGRGVIRVDSKNLVAQRASWLIHFGKIPFGKTVLNSCKNDLCVNPKHLFLGTHRDRDWSDKKIPLKKRFWEKVIVKTGCWGWKAGLSSQGYSTIKDENHKSITAAKASWIIHHGEIKDGLWVLHKCDNPICSNPDHLYLGNHNDNMRDRAERGRGNLPKGEKHHNHKLTLDQIKYIKSKNFVLGERTKLAKEYGVHKSTISAIIQNKNWKYITV